MSARNSHAAKAARRVARQSASGGDRAPSRAQIAEAVHRAVCQVDGSDGFGRCAYYARAGALVASVITGNEYAIQAGEMRVVTDDDAQQALGMIPEASGHSGIEFHAWFGRIPPGAPPGTVRRGNDLELVDLAMRHYRRMAEGIGLTWKREPLPPWFWGSPSDLAALRVSLKPDPVTMQQIIRGQEWDAVREMAAVALRSLGRPRAAAQLLAPPAGTLS